jgi:hypothetical protein
MSSQDLYDSLERFINMSALNDAVAECYIKVLDDLCEKLMNGEKLCNG